MRRALYPVAWSTAASRTPVPGVEVDTAMTPLIIEAALNGTTAGRLGDRRSGDPASPLAGMSTTCGPSTSSASWASPEDLRVGLDRLPWAQPRVSDLPRGDRDRPPDPHDRRHGQRPPRDPRHRRAGREHQPPHPGYCRHNVRDGPRHRYALRSSTVQAKSRGSSQL